MGVHVGVHRVGEIVEAARELVVHGRTIRELESTQVSRNRNHGDTSRVAMHRHQDHRVGTKGPTARAFVATQKKNVVELVAVTGRSADTRKRQRIRTTRCDEDVVDHVGELVGAHHRETGRKGDDQRAENRDERCQPLASARMAIVDHLDHSDEPREHEKRTKDLHDQKNRGVENQTRDAITAHVTNDHCGDRRQYTEKEKQPRHQASTHERWGAGHDQRRDHGARGPALYGRLLRFSRFRNRMCKVGSG